MKIFISQPMTGLDEEEILFTRAKEKARARLMFGDNVEFAPTYTSDEVRTSIEQSAMKRNRERAEKTNWDIYWLVDSLRCMCTCDTLWLVEGWENSKGCAIEREIAETYGLNIYYPKGVYNNPSSWINDKEGATIWETQSL